MTFEVYPYLLYIIICYFHIDSKLESLFINNILLLDIINQHIIKYLWYTQEIKWNSNSGVRFDTIFGVLYRQFFPLGE